MLSGNPELSLETSDAVRVGLGLLNKVECLEAVPASEVSDLGLSDLAMSGGQMMENAQHSPPMYLNTEGAAPTPGQPQQPKVQQMTDLSNCTVNTNNNANTNNNNNNNNSPAPATMTNPLRIKHFAEHSDRELAELATQEISLDLQGLIDDTHFPDDNLFGDLMDTAKKNEVAMYGIGGQGMRGPGSTSTPGSSGQNSPGSEGQTSPTGQPQPGYHGGQHGGHYRQNTLGYIPGSVHHGTSYQQHHHHHPQVKQEPVDQEFSNSCSQAPSSTTNSHYNNNNNPGANNSSYSSNTVSSSTGHHAPGQMSPAPVLPFGLGGPLPSLKSFAQQPKYAMAKKGKNPSQGSDEYRRRRERNNVAVRKSREKAKLRTRETEDRVKILARENERLQKKVELLQEELSVLRSLFSSVGVLPDHIHRELAKHLDNFQAQHAAINY